MIANILQSVKKTLNIATADTAFDADILLHINSVFAILTQLGFGDETGFPVDSTTEWDDFFTESSLNLVKSYTYLKVRMLFDPPTTSYLIDAMTAQITEFEWRLTVMREAVA